MAELFDPRYQAVDANGLPYAGALLYFYRAGTSSLITVFQDSEATTPHTNPVVADAAGAFAPIFLSTTSPVKVVLKTSAGVTLDTITRMNPSGYDGASFDVQVDELADRATYNGSAAGFTVLVSDTGGGRAALYSKNSASSGDWSDPAYIDGPTGPTGPIGIDWQGAYGAGTTYAINDGVKFNGSSFRKLTNAGAGTTPSAADPPVDTTDWAVVAAKGTNGAGSVASVAAGTGVTVDSSDPTAPIVNLASMAESTVKGRAAGGGAGAPQDLTAAQARAVLGLAQNLCFNPGMQSWQNDTTLAAILHRTPLADGFLWGQNGPSVWTGARSTDVPDASVSYSISMTVDTAEASIAASSECHIRYAVYGYKLFPAASTDIKVRFLAKSSKTGIHAVAAVNEARSHTYVAEYTIAAANTWEQHEVTIPMGSKLGTWNLGDGFGLGLRFAMVTGSTYTTTPGAWQTGNFAGSINQVNLADTIGNTFKITKMQIYAEEVPEFVLPAFEDVYQEALRQIRVLTTDVGGVNIALGTAVTADLVDFEIPLGVKMYAPPVTSYKGTLATDFVCQNLVTAVTGIAFTNYARSRDFAKFRFSKTSGFSAGDRPFARLETTSGKLVIDGHLA